MATTSLYVELIIIGLETFIWIASFSLCLTDIKYVSVIRNIIEKLPASIFMIGILYILGLIMDSFADRMFENLENSIRQKSGLRAKSSVLIWKNSGQEEYFKFVRPKIRVLRASSINIPLVTASLIWVCLKYCKPESLLLLFLYISIIGGFLSVSSYKGYKKTLATFYTKAHILEESIEDKKS